MDWLENLELPEVPVVTLVEFDDESLVKLGLVIFITAVLVFWAYRNIR